MTEALESIWAYFRTAHKADPLKAMGQALSRSRCRTCYGRGLYVVTALGGKSTLVQCECLERGLKRMAQKLLKEQRPFAAEDLA